MRILHVTDSFYPTIGGMERAIQGLARQRTSEGHQVAILTGPHPDAPHDENLDGVRILRRPMTTQKLPHALADPARPFHPTFPDPLFMRAVKEAITSHNPDVIHCHGWSRYSVIPVAARHRIPVVATGHDYGFACATKQGTFANGDVCTGPSLTKCLNHARLHYGMKGIPLAAGLRAMAPLQRGITATGISAAVRNFGTGTPYQPPAMTAIPSFIPDEALDITNTDRPDWVPDGDYLMFVGALTIYKGLTVLLEAHEILREQRNLDIPLLLVGTPQPDTPHLDLPNVTTRSNVPHPEVMRAWQHATIGTAPSVIPEGFGQVVVEALAAGTPMIGTNHGGIPEIITHNTNGLLIPPNDPVALADAIETLWHDSDLRARLATAGQERAHDFTLSQVGPRFIDIYRSVIAKVNVRPH